MAALVLTQQPISLRPESKIDLALINVFHDNHTNHRESSQSQSESEHHLSDSDTEIASKGSRLPKKSDRISEDGVSDFINSIQHLLIKYKMYSMSSSSQVSSGGLQQFITRKLQKKSEPSTGGPIYQLTQRLKALYSKDSSVVLHVNEDVEANGSFIQYLPVDLKLHIFSYLDVRSLCTACCVNREWSQLTCDSLLWQRLLERDLEHWSQVSHLTNPQMYLDVGSDWSNKEIYLKCSPEVHQQFRESMSTFNHVSSVLKYFMPKKVPKVAMFGPGLEQSTSGIVRKMIYEDNETFNRVAMFPGQFDGVGGGMTLKMPTGHSLHLSVLYSASRRERENRIGDDRLQQNKMIQVQIPQEGAEADVVPHYELKPQIKHLCQTLDAFIFVIDASQTQESISSCLGELKVMLRERRSEPHIPVLILSCVKQADTPRVNACRVAQILCLSEMSQPWLVIDCESDTLKSVDKGIVWLVNQSQHK